MRSFPRTLRLATALFLAVLWSGYQVVPAAAGLVPSRVSGETSISGARDADLAVVRRALEHRQVAQKLRDYGVEAADVQLRLASLDDQDLHTLASASRGLPSGSDGIGTLVTVLVIVLLVILILKLLNREVVVK